MNQSTNPEASTLVLMLDKKWNYPISLGLGWMVFMAYQAL